MQVTKRYLRRCQLWRDWRVFHRRYKHLWRMGHFECRMARNHTFIYTKMCFGMRVDVGIEFLYGPWKRFVEPPPKGLAFALVNILHGGTLKYRLAVHKDDWPLLPDYVRLRATYELGSAPGLVGLAPTPVRLFRHDGRLVLGGEID